MQEQSIHDDLMEAVTYHNPEAVEECLKKGADPNYYREVSFTKEQDHQPTTPLRLVIFCISDCLLEDNDLKQHAEVAKILLRYGADPKPAMELAELRYGKYNPGFESSPFMDVWHIIANGR